MDNCGNKNCDHWTTHQYNNCTRVGGILRCANHKKSYRIRNEKPVSIIVLFILLGVLTQLMLITTVTLKLIGTISWPWLQVLVPLWVGIGAMAIIIVLLISMAVYDIIWQAVKKRRRNKKKMHKHRK